MISVAWIAPQSLQFLEARGLGFYNHTLTSHWPGITHEAKDKLLEKGRGASY